MLKKPIWRVNKFFDRAWQALRPGPAATLASTPLNAELDALLRGNERIWAGFRELELRLLAAESLRALIEILARDLPALFPGVHVVSLAWLDPDYELSRLLEEEGGGATAKKAFIPLRSPWPEAIFTAAPQLGNSIPEVRDFLFPHDPRPLASMAWAPLRLRGAWMGTLNQGSEDPGHFSAEAATDLLEHLAAVTALCVDNALNRARLRRDGFTDALTGVANRRFFDRRLHEEISLWRRRGECLSCLLVDLDHFKQINDRHGHQIGDLVLQQVARTLNLGLRTSDVLARYGGEEFILLLPDTDSAQAAEIAERLRAAVAALTWPLSPGGRMQVTASFGLACVDSSQRTTLDDPARWLLRQSDSALYLAKAGGRNRVAAARAEH